MYLFICRMEQETCAIGKGLQFPHLPSLPRKGVHKVSTHTS